MEALLLNLVGRVVADTPPIAVVGFSEGVEGFAALATEANEFYETEDGFLIAVE